MTSTQMICLFFMFCIGGLSAPTIPAFWDEMTRRKRVLLVAWLVFWLGPPLYFIWTKGVLG
jgi:hypothetical protein